MKRFALILVLVGGGCAAPRQYFRPAERQHGQTVQGYAEAMYALVGPQGQFGEAKLWSRGSYWGPGGETIIHLAIDLHNTSGTALALNAADVRLESIDTDLSPLKDVPPRSARDRQVGPGALSETGFEFPLPARIAPGEVRGFVVRWTVRGAGQSYTQRTPFVVEYRRSYVVVPYAYQYGYPYYACDPLDPFCPYRYGYYGPPAPRDYYYYEPHGIAPPPPPGHGIVVRPRR